MAAAKGVLAATVHVNGEVYAAGTTPPADVAELITNPKAWADKKSVDSSGDGGASATTITTPPAPGGKPPMVGAGSGLDAWADYATSLGIDVPEDAKKATVVELVNEFEKSQAV